MFQLFHRNLFGAMCLFLSLVFAIIMGIYLSVWNKQNLSGWTQFSIFLAIFFMYLIHGLRTIVESSSDGVFVYNVSTSCRAIGTRD